MQKITKADAVRIIHDCAVLYSRNLSGRNVLFACIHDGKADLVETLFMPQNYMHLTGVRARINSDQFFRAALDNKLGQADISLKRDGILQPVLVDKVNMHELASDFPIPRKPSADGQIKT